MSTPTSAKTRRRATTTLMVAVALAAAQPSVRTIAQPAAEFASLVSDHVELRSTPGADKVITLVFKRAGMPVKVMEERNEWARIQDAEGTGGWVAASLLSRRRTAVVLPAIADATRTLRAAARSTSDVLAYLEPGVIVGVVACDGRTCRITTSGVRGFIDQDHLWGVGEGETIK
jgi:SH3-like domain-containing protein